MAKNQPQNNTYSLRLDGRAPKPMTTKRNWETCAWAGCGKPNVKGITRNPRCDFHATNGRRVSRPRVNHEQDCNTCSFLIYCKMNIMTKTFLLPCQPESLDYPAFIRAHDPVTQQAHHILHMYERGVSVAQIAQHMQISQSRIEGVIKGYD